MSHPHHSFEAILSDGTKIGTNRQILNEVMNSQGGDDLQGTLELANNWLSIRLKDINYVLDQLLEDGKTDEIIEAIDRHHVFLSGHSLGGSAVLAIGRQRPEDLVGIISIEAPFFSDIEGIEGDHYVFTEEEYPLPILHIYSDALWGRFSEITTYEMNQKLIDIKSSKFVNYHVEGSGHIGLTDMSLVSPHLTNLLDYLTSRKTNSKPTEEKLREINQAVLQFVEPLIEQ